MKMLAVAIGVVILGVSSGFYYSNSQRAEAELRRSVHPVIERPPIDSVLSDLALASFVTRECNYTSVDSGVLSDIYYYLSERKDETSTRALIYLTRAITELEQSFSGNIPELCEMSDQETTRRILLDIEGHLLWYYDGV